MDVYTPPRLEDILPKVQLTFRPLSLIAKDKKPHSDKNGIHTSGAEDLESIPCAQRTPMLHATQIAKGLTSQSYPEISNNNTRTVSAVGRSYITWFSGIRTSDGLTQNSRSNYRVALGHRTILH